MKKKSIGTCVALAATVGVLGITACGIGNNEKAVEENRVTLNIAGDEEETETAAAEEETAEETTAETTAETMNVAEEKTEETETETEMETVDAAALAEIADAIQVIPTVDDETDSDGMPNVQQVTANVMPAIVAITNVSKEEVNYFGRIYEADSTSAGSGIIVGKSDTELMIVTNNHMVSSSDELTVCFSVEMDDEDDQDKAIVSAQVKGTDSDNDIAVIAVNLSDIDLEVAQKIGIVQLGNSSDLQVGQWVVAIGNALGEGQSVTAGVVSALDREISASDSDGKVYNNTVIQTDAAINEGNSGGALLDLQGRLIGINEAKTTVDNAEGMGYAIPVDSVKTVIEELMNQPTRSKADEDKAGALGVTVVDVSDEAQSLYNIPAGALVYSLTDSSAAKDAGIQEGDIIVKLDGTTISDRSELLDRMQYYEAGETVTVTVERSGENGYQEQEFEVTLGSKADLEDASSSSSSDSGDDTDSQDSYGYDNSSDGYGYYGNSGNGGFQDLFGGFGF